MTVFLIPSTRTGDITRELLAFATCAIAGVLISVLPHLIWWQKLGEPVWIADHDDVVYMTVASSAHGDGHFSLSDPVDPEGKTSVGHHPHLVPGLALARLLGWSTIRINLAWRICAGLTMAAGWYLVFRHYVGRVWLAAALAIVCLADVGYVNTFQPLLRQAVVLAKIASGSAVYDMLFHGQLRIVNPALTLPYLLVFVWAMVRARERPSIGRIVFAGLACGALFYVYFYFWTAAGLALALALALDRGHRRVYLYAGCIGLLVVVRPSSVRCMSSRRWRPIGSCERISCSPSPDSADWRSRKRV